MDRECQYKQLQDSKQIMIIIAIIVSNFPFFPNNFVSITWSIKKTNKLLRNLDTKKCSQDTYIPTRIMQENFDLFAHFLLNDSNNLMIKSEFPQTLKNANVTPLDILNSQNDESNYRPVSILSNFSKVYAKCMG